MRRRKALEKMQYTFYSRLDVEKAFTIPLKSLQSDALKLCCLSINTAEPANDKGPWVAHGSKHP